MLTYGPWALGAATLVSALGLPLPATMLLLAAGAFMRQGALDWQAAVILAALGAVLGDSGSYLLGRYGGTLTLGRAPTPTRWRQAQSIFQRWGGLTIFISRFLLTPLALPVNLLAGSTRYTPWRFLGSVVSGELLWVFLFSGLGYVFADRWEALSDLTGDLSLIFVGLTPLLLGGGYLLRRVWLGQRKKIEASHSMLRISNPILNNL
jgi:membrane protein DedA with SNARE-associated domain